MLCRVVPPDLINKFEQVITGKFKKSLDIKEEILYNKLSNLEDYYEQLERDIKNE